jgi:ribosomal protein S18 acetylase RimI-like enzyme
VGAFRVAWIEEGDEAGLEEARELARSRVLDLAPIYASFECSPIRKRSRFIRVSHRDRLVALAAVVERIFPYRSVPVWASLPGATRQLFSRVDPPFVALAAQPVWHEVVRCGGQRTLEEVQMARLSRSPLPDADPRLERLERVEEVQAFLGPRFSPVHFEVAPFLGIRDSGGALLACGGAQLVTDRIAQIAYMRTEDDRRGEGLGTAILVGLIRELETEKRRLVLQVRVDNHPAMRLYARFGFRGRVRTALFSVNEPVSAPTG